MVRCRCSSPPHLLSLHALEASARLAAALEPGLEPALSLTLPAPAALSASFSIVENDLFSSRPREAGQEEQVRRQRRVELSAGSFGGWRAWIRRERGATLANWASGRARESIKAEGLVLHMWQEGRRSKIH